MTLLPLQTLYFDDLSVGMTETYAKTVKVVGRRRLVAERQRARLGCQCRVGGTVVLEGDAMVKIPRRPGLTVPIIGARVACRRGRSKIRPSDEGSDNTREALRRRGGRV